MNTTAVKILSETDQAARIGGYGVVFGGKDLDNQYFTKDTNFWFEQLSPTPPLLYSHGMDEAIGKAPIGTVTAKTVDDDGVFFEAEIQKSAAYATQVLELIRKGVMGMSSGAVAHLVEVARGGHIKSWPLAELSLTVTPAEPRTLGVAELKALDIDVPEAADVPEPKPVTVFTTKAAPGSYEAVMMAVHAALNEQLNIDPFAEMSRWASIEATYPDHVIARLYDEGDCTYYSVDYAIDDAGAVTLGPAMEVEQIYVPAGRAAVLSARYLTLRTQAAALLDDTKGLLQRRAKEGRVLSASNRAAIQRWLDGMAAMDDLRKEMTDLLAATEPQPAKAASVEQALAEQLALLRLFVEPVAA